MPAWQSLSTFLSWGLSGVDSMGLVSSSIGKGVSGSLFTYFFTFLRVNFSRIFPFLRVNFSRENNLRSRMFVRCGVFFSRGSRMFDRCRVFF